MTGEAWNEVHFFTRKMTNDHKFFSKYVFQMLRDVEFFFSEISIFEGLRRAFKCYDGLCKDFTQNIDL